MRLFFAALIFLSVSLGACTNRGTPGTKDNPVIFALIPGKDTLALETDGKILVEYLKKKTGYHIELLIPFSYVGVVEALGTSRADFAIMNSFGYLLANEKNQAQAALITLSSGRDHYFGEIIAHADGIKSVQQINGKSFAFVDPASTSGYLMAEDLFKKENIKPRDVIFAGRHDTVVAMVYQKRVDAGAAYWSPDEDGQIMDARKLVKAQFPDVAEKVIVLQKTGPIPNDPVVVRKNLDAEVAEKITQALLDSSQDAKAAGALKRIYNITGFRRATDKEYDGLRALTKSLGKTSEELMKK